MLEFIKKLNIDFSKFNLYDDDFSFISDLHGKAHVFNVMYNVLLIGNELNDVKNTKIAFCAAYIHDLSRRNDGYCQIHGSLSVKEKFPKYEKLFISIGLNEDDLECVKIAAKYHSLNNELDKSHKHYTPTAILKDADALDRVRLDDLDPNYLRFKESRYLTKKSEELYFKNYNKEYNSFEKFLNDNL